MVFEGERVLLVFEVVEALEDGAGSGVGGDAGWVRGCDGGLDCGAVLADMHRSCAEVIPN